jgi:hypothetical protein
MMLPFESVLDMTHRAFLLGRGPIHRVAVKLSVRLGTRKLRWSRLGGDHQRPVDPMVLRGFGIGCSQPGRAGGSEGAFTTVTAPAGSGAGAREPAGEAQGDLAPGCGTRGRFPGQSHGSP